MKLAPRLLFALGAAVLAVPGPVRADAPDRAALWQAYKAKFLTDEGRILDEAGASTVSHSEGQGYGLLLAAFNDDPVAFDRIWSWTKANLYVRGDDLAAWRWRPEDSPHTLDMNNATDGDILIAWALAEGGERFKRKDFAERARRIAHVVAWSLTFPTKFGPAIAPGKVGFGKKDRDDGPVVNPSYWVYPAFAAFARVAPDVDWGKIAESGKALLAASRTPPSSLPPDWVSLAGDPHPAKGFPARFGYDAIRVPLYLFFADPGDRAHLTAFAEWAKAAPLSAASFDSATKPEAFEGSGYRAIAALVRCGVSGEAIPADLLTPEFERYYPSTLHMLALEGLRRSPTPCAG